jgi:protein-tyrosine phosphatase
MMDRNHLMRLEEADASRTEDHIVEICWEPPAIRPGISVCAGLSEKDPVRWISPDQVGSGKVTLAGLAEPVRYYYRLNDANGTRLLIAERRVMMEGAVNFRDIGGYRTTDGRRVKWGSVFRADGLSRLTTRDHRIFRHMGIRRVFDFRTHAEVFHAPNRLPDDVDIDYVHLPVVHGEFDFVSAMARIKKGDTGWLTPDFMLKGYIGNLEKFAGVWGRVINGLADPAGMPMVFHCTGGKDRTGTCAALILLMLGVPEETVMADHQLSNFYIATLLPRISELMASYGVDPEVVNPYLTAPKECIRAVLDYIRDRYGSVDVYLADKAGVSSFRQEEIRRHLLTAS